VCLQAYVPPHLDLRYITTYVCDNGEVSCTTFPRRFGRRYQDAPAPPPPPPGARSSHSSHPRYGTPGASFDANRTPAGTPNKSGGPGGADGDDEASPPPPPPEVGLYSC
jgi:hypothetical protein